MSPEILFWSRDDQTKQGARPQKSDIWNGIHLLMKYRIAMRR